MELALRGISFRRQVPIALQYKRASVGQARLDLVVDARLVVELKASESLLPIHLAQVLSYLKTTGHHSGCSSTSMFGSSGKGSGDPDALSAGVPGALAVRPLGNPLRWSSMRSTLDPRQ